MVTQPSTTLHEQKSYAGDVQARQQTALAFRVGGQVTARYVDVGDRVRVGQVLAKLDVADAQLQLNAAKAQLENAQAAAKTASDELKRFQQLLPINAVSRSQYDTVKNQYDAAQAALQQARSNSVHDKFHRTLILSGFCLLKIAKISLNSSFFPKPIKR
ncbi:efflux transporter, RND family, MFP subunit [Acinetobacter baumannii 25569_2]|nr:efflux transporter, RND family, MFP subunit [Acinetobacter baumannii 25569_7]EYS37577.1 efflux transporter, RND family, MFP subunit [Acinetobacter baumannii 25569_4]EYS38643.1 efflux transporter, RND family, MFP subunit [Acinetobacter baumannii 25569_2]